MKPQPKKWGIYPESFEEIAIKEGETLVCMVYKPICESEETEQRANSAEANARLIAAAPELLEAAQKIAELSDRCNNAMLPQSVQDLLKHIEEISKSAINKATNQ
jgi:hypothetical protein